MVVKPGKRKDFLGICGKICGVPFATLRRGGGNGQYEVVFQRCDAALEDIEGIDWARPAVTEATDRYLSDPLPEGYGFTVEDITYYHGTETWTVHLRTARQFLGDVTGYQAQVEALEKALAGKELELGERAAEIAGLQSQLAEADETAIALYETLLTAEEPAPEEVSGDE